MSLIFNTSAGEEHGGADFYNGVATQSVRFPIGEAHLQRTPGTSGNQKKWTSSFWIKRTSLGSAYLWSGASYSGNDGIAAIYFSTDDSIHTYYDTSGANPVGKVGGGLYRDLTAWYHICWAVDAANTVHKIWVNGVLISTDTGKYPVDFDYGMNRATSLNKFGEAAWGNSTQFEGYLADFVHLDGQYLEYDSFAEFKNGVLIPIDTSGLTYGTNGFRLEFKENAVGTGDTDTIGADTANSNHLDSAVIAADDCNMPDSPENNFATGLGELSEATNDQGYISAIWSEGNLRMTPSAGNWSNGMSNFGMTSGKWYAEAKVVNIGPSGTYTRFGMRASPIRTYDEYFWLAGGNGQIDAATSPYSARVGTYANGNVLQIALDLENNALYFGKNGTWENSATTSEIAAGTVTNAFASGTTLIPTGDGFTYFFYFNMHPHATAPVSIWNYGQDPSFAGELDGSEGNEVGTATPSEGAGVFLYAPPDGFLACCTANLPEPTIGANSDTQADNHFGILTWSGDDGATRKIATGESAVTGTVDFTPDWSWIKRRNGASNGSDHLLLDIVRGVDAFNGLSANTTQAEGLTAAGSTWVNFGDINNFETGGFTVQKGTDGSHTLEGINQSGGTYVGWNWKAGGAPTADNSEDAGATPTAGSVKIDGVNLGSALAGTTAATRLTANTTAGFSIIKYAGNAASKTVAHGLNSAPTFVIAKSLTDAERWVVFHNSISTKYIYLNETYAGETSNADERFGNSTSVVVPNDTVVTMGASNSDINEDGDNYIMYAFHEVEGYSKFGKYAGGGSGGEFVYLGFRPAFVIFKVDAASTQWLIFDSTRATSNLIDDVVLSTTIQVEGFSSGMELDFLSNGFKIRGSNNDISYSGKTHIYMAFAEAPFKYANAR